MFYSPFVYLTDLFMADYKYAVMHSLLSLPHRHIMELMEEYMLNSLFHGLTSHLSVLDFICLNITMK